jgi:hypothetical protein
MTTMLAHPVDAVKIVRYCEACRQHTVHRRPSPHPPHRPYVCDDCGNAHPTAHYAYMRTNLWCPCGCQQTMI